MRGTITVRGKKLYFMSKGRNGVAFYREKVIGSPWGKPKQEAWVYPNGFVKVSKI